MIDNLQYAFDGAWRVLVASLVFGAGLPVLYAFGIRSLAWGAGGDAEVSHAQGNPLGKVVAGLRQSGVVRARVPHHRGEGELR
jgi:hypothetical protein